MRPLRQRKRLWPALGMGLSATLALAPPYESVEAPSPTEPAIRKQLAEILARPEFSPEGAYAGWLELIRRIAALFDRWLGSVSGLSTASPVVFWIVIGLCVLVLFLLLGHIAWTIHRVLFVSAAPGVEDGAAHERRRRSVECWEEARRMAAQGEFTEAIRFLFLALVYRFDESGRVSFQKAYTNREYLALFVDRPQIHAGLKLFVEVLDRHWYGQRRSDRQLYENCLTVYQSLQ